MIGALVAGAIAAIWAAVHVVIGGRQVARPLREDRTLPPIVRETMWMCWHMVTAALVSMAALLLWGGWSGRADLVLAGTLLAAAVSVAGIVAIPVLGTTIRRLPQGLLFLPVVALGVLALVG
ncbi:hypothetical protein [uncultured Jannaschia sp.]|uniref:hypothetical protein n=1 Tax=uncultured Jannaschia sp. TaxID=293347 RepID=UPI0026352C5F|nr:hypothetical protein [uncultured Jannaschia sp.]